MRFDKFLTLIKKYETIEKEDLDYILDFSLSASINDFKNESFALWRFFYISVNDVSGGDVNFLLKHADESVDLNEIKDAFLYVKSHEEEEVLTETLKVFERKNKQIKFEVVSFISSFCTLRDKTANLKFLYESVKKEEV